MVMTPERKALIAYYQQEAEQAFTKTETTLAVVEWEQDKIDRYPASVGRFYHEDLKHRKITEWHYAMDVQAVASLTARNLMGIDE